MSLPIQSALIKDAPAYCIGLGTAAFCKFAKATEIIAPIAEQLGVILGCILVFVTLVHRLFLFWKDSKK